MNQKWNSRTLIPFVIDKQTKTSVPLVAVPEVTPAKTQPVPLKIELCVKDEGTDEECHYSGKDYCKKWDTYTGTKSETRAMRTCQNWMAAKDAGRTDYLSFAGFGDHNHCRASEGFGDPDPVGTFSAPWCFLTDAQPGEQSWDFCFYDCDGTITFTILTPLRPVFSYTREVLNCEILQVLFPDLTVPSHQRSRLRTNPVSSVRKALTTMAASSARSLVQVSPEARRLAASLAYNSRCMRLFRQSSNRDTTVFIGRPAESRGGPYTAESYTHFLFIGRSNNRSILIALRKSRVKIMFDSRSATSKTHVSKFSSDSD